MIYILLDQNCQKLCLLNHLIFCRNIENSSSSVSTQLSQRCKQLYNNFNNSQTSLYCYCILLVHNWGTADSADSADTVIMGSDKLILATQLR